MSRIQIQDLPRNEELQPSDARQVMGGSDVAPLEQISLNFGKIEHEYAKVTPKLMLECARGQH